MNMGDRSPQGRHSLKNMRPTVLYIDDEVDNLNIFKTSFRHDYNVIVAESTKQGLYFLRQTPVDIIISDYRMPVQSGIDFFIEIENEFADVNRIIITAYGDQELLLKSINHTHIYGFVSKPWNKIELKRLMDSAIQSTELKKKNKELVHNLFRSNSELEKANEEISRLKELTEIENKYCRFEIDQDWGIDQMIGNSPTIKSVLLKIRQVSRLNTTVLIQGETGTGKELVTRYLHKLSHRALRPLIKLNCSSLPASLVESELFGHEKGAFTGAIENKPGLFEIANDGTIFLDEVGELPIEVQPKLLRVLQDGEFYKVGGSKPTITDVRVIAATNRNLDKCVQEGKFRADLYYRLNIFPVDLPPLRHRKEDIPALVDHFVIKYQKKVGKSVTDVTPNFIESLLDYHWPGNIRELEAVIERSIITSQTGRLDTIEQIHPKSKAFSFQSDVNLPLDEIDKAHILRVLEKTKGKISGPDGAAEILKLNHNTLRSRMIKLRIDFKAGK